jgi:hypothetical protein
VAGFVDGQGASAYLAMARLGRNRTINGMAYAADAETLSKIGGFAAMGHSVTDDWAIAQLFARHGRPIVQTVVPARVAVTLSGPIEALRLLRRWTVFAHRYVGANLDAAMVGLVGAAADRFWDRRLHGDQDVRRQPDPRCPGAARCSDRTRHRPLSALVAKRIAAG